MAYPIVEGFRLSPPQRHLWLRHGADVGPYRVRAVVSISGPLDRVRLERAVHALVERHEILRTVYRQLPGMRTPMQVVEPNTPWRLDADDLQPLDFAAQAAAVDAAFASLADTPIDLESGPVFRARLLVHSAADATLLLMWPSIVADATSAGIVVRELVTLLDGAEDDDRPMQHVDVAEWQHELLEADGTAAGREFWQPIDRDVLLASRLQLHGPLGRDAGAAPRTIATPLPHELATALSACAAAHACTPDDVLRAGWQLLMWRLTERTEFVAGIGADGRSLEDLQGVVSPLARPLPVRCTIDPGWSFADLLERSRAAYGDHLRWQSLFVWHGVDENTPTSSLPFCPLRFETCHWSPILSHDGATWTLERVDGGGDRAELKTTVAQTPRGWTVWWTYDEPLHTAEQVACIADQYIQILRAVTRRSQAAIAGIDIRGEWERVHAQPAPVRFARAAAADSFAATHAAGVHQLFEARAAATPDREAVIAGDQRLTYGELNRGARQIAAFLRAQGVRPETRVGVYLEHSIDLLVAVLGILKAGGAFVPLPSDQPAARLASLAGRAGAPLVITHRHLAASWPSASAARLVRLDADAATIAAAPSPDGVVPCDPAQLAYVMFTSGSTGEPKGVMVPHGALMQYVTWSRAAYLQDGDVDVLLHSSIGFDATITSLLMPLSAGARVIVAPGGADSVDAIATLASAPGRRGFLKVTPAHLALVAARVAGDALASVAPTLVIGGEALHADQLAAWQAYAPATRVVNEYGPTEATVGCVAYDTVAGAVQPGPVPIGRPIAGVVCHAIDPYGQPAAVGVTGELYVGGAQLARGYDGRPDLTAERFVPDPTSTAPGARCYRTGDLVRVRADGAFDYVGRRDSQVKVRGYRVELAEVEGAVRQQPAVRDAVVVLREDTPGDRRLVAYIVAAPDATIVSDRLQQALRATLPDYMVPAVFVPLDALPVTANGKVDRARLPIPEGARPALTDSYVEPRSRAETILAKIWADVLRLDRVGIHDNFFALGGDSILSLQIVARAGRAGLRLAPRLVFEHPTVEALAGAASRAAAAPIDQGPVTGIVPVTPILRWFFEQSVDDRHHYNQALALDLTQPLSPSVLTEAWLRLQVHHDALRLRYRRAEAGWEQFNADVDHISGPAIVDATGVAEAHRPAAWARIAAACQRSLDLERGPIARAALVQWGGDTPARLLIVLHHLVADGMSWRVLLEDLQELCRREPAQTAPIDLPPKTTSVKKWAETLSTLVTTGAFDAELPLWIAASESSPALPRDRWSDANSVASQRTIDVTLGADETAALLHRLPVSLDVHVQDALLAALVTALARWSGEPTWRIDLEGHGREPLGGDEDVSRTMGWFTSVYPVRVATADADDLVGTLRAVRAAVRRVPRYGVGYGALRYLRDDAATQPLRDAPSPEIILNYWGQLDQVFASSAAIRPAADAVGPTRSPRQSRSHVFEISASIIASRLHVSWTYSANLHDADTIDRLARDMGEVVCRLAALPDHARASLRTPADFPLAALTEFELDRIVAGGGPVADIYPLSPMQEGMLFHRLYDTDAEVYTQQFTVRLNGSLDPAAFRHAWEATVARHDILRTAFLWERRERPLQVVREQAPLPWTFDDWRGLDPAEQDARLAARLDADRRRGFDIAQPPLMRVGLIRLAADRWQVLWTSHHLILDGWSMPIVVRDVLTAYAGPRAERPAAGEPQPPRYADYIAWLQRQSDSAAEQYWRRALDGLTAPTIVAAPRAAADESPSPLRDTLRAELPASLVDALQRLGRTHRITMNSWFAGAWALLIAHATRQHDVVFGTVVSGRPVDLTGIETIPGLFINTLPLRLNTAPGRPALEWFAECQQRQVEARDYEYASLARIQSWCALPAGAALFDTVFVYENYPADHAWRQQTELRVEQAGAVAATNYPIETEVAGTGSQLVVTMTVDRTRVGSALARFLCDGFDILLSRLVATPEATIGALLEHLDEIAIGAGADDTSRRRSARQASLRRLKHAASGAASAEPQFT